MHTPGPWEFKAIIAAPLDQRPSDEAFLSCPDFFGIISGDKVICEVVPAEWRPFPESDARLIAAAPELLRALKALRAQVPPYSLGSSLLGQVDDAIAKAEEKS